jgi:hypothetical protein
MSKLSRIVGKNIELAVKKKYANVEDFRKDIDFTQRDLDRLFTGRVLVNFKKFKQISELVEVPVVELLDTNKDYTFVHAYGEFSNRDNEHKILDFIDDYIDLIEITGGYNK